MYGDESYTTPGDDILVGGRGNDLIFAGAGNDTVMAGKGEDTLRGGEGRDLLVGIADGMVDAFVFNVLADSGVGKARDRIVGFETGLDVIDLHFIDADTSRSGDQKFQFSDVGPVENGLWFTQKAIGIIVHADVDGDSVADFELRLTGLSSISAQDFIL
jgi:serralysin